MAYDDMTPEKAIKLAQRKAALEAELARLTEAESSARRALENGQKIVMGGAVLALLREDPEQGKAVLAQLRKHITRAVDVKRVEPIFAAQKLDPPTVLEKPKPPKPPVEPQPQAEAAPQPAAPPEQAPQPQSQLRPQADAPQVDPQPAAAVAIRELFGTKSA